MHMQRVDPGAWIAEVSRDDVMRHTAEIARWVRLTGSEDERRAFEYIDEVLRGFGLTTTLHLPTCLVSLPLSGSLVVGEEHFVPCITHSFSITTPPDGVAGQLVYAGRGTEADLAAAGARGRIALTDGLATPQKAHAATQAGALAIVNISGDHVHEMIVSPVWGSPTPDRLDRLPNVPMVSIDTEAGERLRRQLEQGPTRARVGTVVDTGWRQIPVLVADLDILDRDYVMFSGHVDSWHYGAMDNGSANATMIEVARIMAAHRSELRRGVRFAFWSGHSHARYAGSTWFADAYWFDLRARCVAHVNVDSTGATGATQLTEANTMADTYPLAREVIGRQTDQDLAYRRFGRAGDQSFWGVGLPSFFMSLSQQGAANEMTTDQAFLLGGTAARGGGLGWWWHTTEDTLDKIDPDNLARDARVYVEVVGRLATDAVIPLDPGAAIDEIERVLDDIEPQWSNLPTGGPDDDPGFALLRADLAEARLAAQQASAAVQHAEDKDGAQLSAALLAACKSLVPVNYTRAGEFDHDLALGAAPLPALRPHRPVVEMTDDELWGSIHQLRRSINRVRAGVRGATAALQTVSG
jgi:hypothetical protein